MARGREGPGYGAHDGDYWAGGQTSEQYSELARLRAVADAAKPLHRYLKLSDNPLVAALGDALYALDGTS